MSQAIAQVLGPIFDPGFSESSFGFIRPIPGAHPSGQPAAVQNRSRRFCRPGRSAHGAIRQVQRHIGAGDQFAVDLDRELERRGHRFARYADDLLILVRSPRAGARVKASITRYLDRVLRLPVNERKSPICRTNAVVFLGFTFRGTKLRWSDAAFDDFQHRLRRLTGRSWGVSMGYRLHQLAQYLTGWMNYFGISDYYRPVPELDQWLRRRTRMCYWKQWRRVRTKVRHLLALGTGKRQAILTALSRKSYWHLSRTLATQTGMTTAWLARQGLPSVRDL